jgi:hypothetical protein
MPINQEELQRMMERALQEAAATVHAALVIVGDKLGLYKALAQQA